MELRQQPTQGSEVRVGIDGASCEHSKREKDEFEMMEGFLFGLLVGSEEIRPM